MELDSYFTPDFSVDDFLDIVMAQPVDEQQTVVSPTSKPKSPKRKTFGALINDLKEEIHDLRLEIEMRDAYIMSLIHELYYKNKDNK